VKSDPRFGSDVLNEDMVFVVTVRDPNPGDTMYARWLVDYPRSENPARIPGREDLVPAPEDSRRYGGARFQPDCAQHGISKRQHPAPAGAGGLGPTVHHGDGSEAAELLGQHSLVSGRGVQRVVVPEGVPVKGKAAGNCFIVLLALLAGCGDDGSACDQDGDCGAAAVCLRSTCVPRAGPAEVHWALEVAPGPQVRFAARELPDQALGGAVVDLPVDRKVSMMASLSGPPEDGLATASSVGVVLAVPSAIPGRGELKFETEGTSPALRCPTPSHSRCPNSCWAVGAPSASYPKRRWTGSCVLSSWA
jgi:hypothetical protein